MAWRGVTALCSSADSNGSLAPFLFEFKLLGHVWCDSPLLTIMVRQKAITIAEGCHTRLDHSAEKFAEGRRALKAEKAL